MASLLPVATAEPRDTPRCEAAAATAAPDAPDDFTMIDGIMQTFYAVVSAPAGQPRAWERDRRLYIPEVRFVAIVA